MYFGGENIVIHLPPISIKMFVMSMIRYFQEDELNEQKPKISTVEMVDFRIKPDRSFRTNHTHTHTYDSKINRLKSQVKM